LDEIPGVDWTLAAGIIAEMGVDMSVFGSVSQLASWAGVCPGNNESAGKRKSSRIPKGNVYLKTALVEAANSAAKAKGTYLRDKFYRLKARRGYKRNQHQLTRNLIHRLERLATASRWNRKRHKLSTLDQRSFRVIFMTE
jgi:transposase